MIDFVVTSFACSLFPRWFPSLRFNCTVMMLVVSVCLLVAHAQAVGDEERLRYESISTLKDRQLYDMALKNADDHPDSALMYYDILSRRYSPDMESADAELCADAMLKASEILYHHFNYNSAMDMLLKCRNVCEHYGFTDKLAVVYRMIGNIYSVHGDYDRGIDFYRQSLLISEGRHDVDNAHLALNNLVGASLFGDDIELATSYYHRMEQNKSTDPLKRYDILLDGGILEIYRKNPAKALGMIHQAADYAISNKLPVSCTGAANSWLAKGHEALGQHDSTLFYLHENERLARSENQQDLLVETLRSLSDTYRTIGQREKSMAYLEEYLELSQDIFDQKKFNSLKNSQFQYELNKSEGIISNLNEEKLRHEASLRLQKIIIIAVVVILLIVVTFLVIISRHKKRLSAAYNDLYRHHSATLEKEKRTNDRILELESHLTQAESFVPDTPPVEEMEKSGESGGVEIPDSLKEYLRHQIPLVMGRSEIFCDPAFSIARLAEEVNSNTTYLSKFINETYGMNFRSFLNEYRIKESMWRLADKTGQYSSQTIKAIGESVGFKSQSAYIAAFTKFTGMKPSIYQAISRKEQED